MIVVNKGRGRGFRSCKCGWTFAVSAGTPPASHRNPYTAIECQEKPSPIAFHLAHTFHTDVLQIRIRREVGLRPETVQAMAPEDLNRAREGVARSIAESVRLAACQLLEIPEKEMDATYRWKPQGMEIILYDSVSGGAGYCKKVCDLQLSGLLEGARRVLECAAQCSMSCSRCLRSYSNQAYWEDFRRLDALAWVKETLAMKKEGQLVASGATEITLPRVRELCSQATRIVLIRHAFGDLDGPIPVNESTARETALSDLYPGWGMVQKWLADGKEVELVSFTRQHFRDRCIPRGVRLADAFLPHVREGRLTLRIAGDTLGLNSPIAVLIDEGSNRSSRIYSPDYVGTALDTEWPPTLFEVEGSATNIVEALPDGEALTFGEVSPPEGVEHKRFAMGEARDLEQIFHALKAAQSPKIEIIDRYLFATDHNLALLDALMEKLAKIWTSTPAQIRFIYGPAAKPEDDSVWRNNAFKKVVTLQRVPELTGVSLLPEMRSHRGPKGDKHDRRILVRFKELVPPATPTKIAKKAIKKPVVAPIAMKTLTVELTGGVAHLMDEKSETNVFYWLR